MVPTRFRQSSVLATAALVAICAIWGATFTLVKEALNDASALVFLTLRFGVATAALWLAIRFQGPIGTRGYPIRHGAFLGAALFGGYLFQTIGLRFTTPGRSAFLTGLFIVFVPLLHAVYTRRFPALHDISGITVAFAGLALLAWPFSFSGTGLGDGLTVICALSYAVHILLLGDFSKEADARALTLSQIAFALLLCLATFWWVEEAFLRSSARLWLAVGFTGVLATALAFLAQTWAQRHVSAARTAFIFALEPLFALLTSFFLAGERFGPAASAGALLIFAGILLFETKLFRRKSTSRADDSDAAALGR